MSTPAFNEDSGGSVEDIAAALNELRDVLVDLSLTMKDLKFEIDSVGRSDALEKSKELVERIKCA